MDVFTTASAGVPNQHGRPGQDRWATGANWYGAYVVVADGITVGRHGDLAATVAAVTAAAALATTDLTEGRVLAAVMLAHSAVAPWYADGSPGGTTLAVATLTRDRVVAASVGDSAVLAGEPTGVLTRLNPRPPAGPLTEWIGQPAPLTPWLQSWPVTGPQVIAATSDGVDADGTSLPGSDAAAAITRMWQHGQLRNGDDACAAVATLIWVPTPAV